MSKKVRTVIAPTEDYILSAARDKTVRSWKRDSTRSFSVESIYTGSHGFVNAVAYMKPSKDNPSGLIITAGTDKIINVYNPAKPAEPIYTLIGHTENVCSLDVSPSGDILSGSWDKTARIWRNWQPIFVLEGHSLAVWDVLSIPGGGEKQTTLTASADKSIRLWLNDKHTRSFLGHTDVVRSLAFVPNIGFLSCSNDSSIRLWSLESGQCLQEFHGHTSYIYSISVIPGPQLEFATSGEDRSVRIWRDGQNIQTILQPCISVWSVTAGPNGDIVVGGSDAVVRVFSRNEERWADAESLSIFDTAVVTAQTAPSKPASATYQGKQYDYVFDIDVGEGVPPLKLPYNITENPYQAAQNFLQRNDLPMEYIDQIVNFIIKNASAVNVGSENAYGDPLTGANRYTPGSGSASGLPTYRDPFTGAGSYVPGGSNNFSQGNVTTNPPTSTLSTSTKILPQRSYLTFKNANLPAITKKIADINSSLTPPQPVDLVTLESLTQSLSTPSGNPIPPKQIEALIHLIQSWPLESRFPGLDLLRLVALRGVELEGHEWIDFITRYTLEGTYATEGILRKEEETNIMLGLRSLANLFETDTGRDLITPKSSMIISSVVDLLGRMSNKNSKLPLVTLFLNFSVLFCTSPDETGAFQIVGVLVEFLKIETDQENIFRALVAVGTLISTIPSAKEAAELLEMRKVIAVLKKKQSTEGRNVAVANEIASLL